MDRWESAIEELQKSQTLDSFGKVLLTAESVLKEDLAPFEFDWFVQTLLRKPVCLLDAIPEWVAFDVWWKLVRDAYKLMAHLLDNHYDRVDTYFGDIVAVCETRQAAGTRSSALLCLTRCVRRELPPAAVQYVAELPQASTCKAPLAVLVGAICECHPDAVADQFIVIWRNYLNLLRAKNTDKVCDSLLRGVWGLFKHFGVDIPVRELNEFYECLSREYFTRCNAAAVAILRDYSPLFRERIARDAEVRRALWCSGAEEREALRPVYQTVATVLTAQQLQNVIDTEIVPRTLGDNYKIKFTALRIASALHRLGHTGEPAHHVDVYALEFQLRGEVGYEAAEALSWCLEANVANSDKLLQTAMIFYGNLPASRRKDVVVNGLLNSPPDAINVALNFLVTESCRSEEALLTHLALWRDVMESELAEQKNVLLDIYIDNFLLVVDNYLDGDDVLSYDKDIPSKLSTLLSLSGHVLGMAPAVWVQEACGRVAPRVAQLLRAGLRAPPLAVLAALAPYLEQDQHLTEIYETLRLEKCSEEAALCAACAALVRLPVHVHVHVHAHAQTLHAIEIILTRKDAEPNMLCVAIEKLESIIVGKDSFDKCTVSKCIRHIEKLRLRKELVGKHARVLQRDVTMFLGKYLNVAGNVDPLSAEDNTLIVQVRDELTLELPNPTEGITYKINLHRLLYTAIVNEHEHSLRMMLNIICAKLCSGASPALQAVLGRVLGALCRARAGATGRDTPPLPATYYCSVDATRHILQQIRSEKSPAVRRMLSELVEGILLKDPGSAANELQLRAVHAEAAALLTSTSSLLKLGGLEITECLLTALRSNRHQTQVLLPNLTLLAARTHAQDSAAVLGNATKLFIENIGLFSATVLDDTTNELLQTVLDRNWEVADPKVYKSTVKAVLSFARDVTSFTKENTSKVTMEMFDLRAEADAVKFLYVLTEIPNYFELVDNDVKGMLDYENGSVLEAVFGVQLEVLEAEFALETHLKFISQFATVLFQFHSQRTLKHMSCIIDRLPPKYVRSQRRYLSECLTRCRQMVHSTPDCLLKSLESWSEGLALKDITEHVEKEKFTSDHALHVSALDQMMEIFQLKNPTAILTTVSVFAKNWANIVLRIYASGHIKYFKKHVPYLTDLLSVSLRFHTLTEIKSFILDRNQTEMCSERVGVGFCRYFMTSFFKSLVRKPFLLLREDMESCCTLLHDAVKCGVRRRWRDDQLENLLELVDQLWPAYEVKASFKFKHSVLLELRAHLTPAARPVRWAVELLACEHAPVDQKIALLAVLPPGDAYSETYRRYASMLPTRLSDMDARSRAALRALLDAAAGGAHTSVLDILVTLANGDDTAGWWDEAFDSCMVSLAGLPSMTLDVLTSVYSRALCSSPAVCSRLLVPLLRYSPPSLCEKFFAGTLSELLAGLCSGLKAPSLHAEYRTCVQQKTILLNILQVLLERVPAAKIESPSSPLYEHIETDKPWHAAREVIRLCFRLRDKLLTPADAPPPLHTLCREFQQSAFMCMCACVCVRRPEPAAYAAVWDARAWPALVCPTRHYHMPLRATWHQRKIHKSVSIPIEGEASASARTRTGSRSRVFLRTPSENPLDYDLIDHTDTHMNETAEVELTENSLNQHPCASTLTALFRHPAGGVSHARCRGTLCAALRSSTRNLRWLLAQAVCNCRDELKQYASELRPALLAVVADADTHGTHTSLALLNSLHIDILKTLIQWKDDAPLPAETHQHLNAALAGLVLTALESCASAALFRMLEEVLEGMLACYGAHARGDFAVFADSFDNPNRTKACLKLLLCFAKRRVSVPDLLPTLLTKLADNHNIYRSEVTLLAELIGLEIHNSDPQLKSSAATELKKILEDVRKHSVADYVKIVYYSKCCDAKQFRSIVELTMKLPEAERKRCLRVVSTYMRAHADTPEVADMPNNIREMAGDLYGDMHFDELFSSTPQFLVVASSSAKRPRLESPILCTIGRNEKYIAEVLSRLGSTRLARLDEKLCNTDMAVRLAECFYLCVYLPVRWCAGERAHLPHCLAEFLRALFSRLNAQGVLKQRTLRDEPWTVENEIPGSVRTRTRKFVGTLRSFSYDTVRYAKEDTETEAGIDVQVSIDKVLDCFIQFAEVTPCAAMELAAQVMRGLGGAAGRGFDSRPVVARLTSAALRHAPELVHLARECAQQLPSVDGALDVVGGLTQWAIGSEGEHVFRLLNEEIKLRSGGPEQFVLGNVPKLDLDDPMCEKSEFSIENMVSAFRKLSDWEEVPLRERRRALAALPPLWTDKQHFKQLLDEYTVADDGGWFGQTVQLYRGGRHDLVKWLRAADRWPRNHNALAAVVEGMQWDAVDLELTELLTPCRIDGADCLAEWAARLMLRTAYITEKWDSEAAHVLYRSHELQWCRSANERGLHEMALTVIRRNCLDVLYEGETLEWMELRLVAACSLAGGQAGGRGRLEETAARAHSLRHLYAVSPPDAVIRLSALLMNVDYTLQSLSHPMIDSIMSEVATQTRRLSGDEAAAASGPHKQHVTELCETAVLYYDSLWDGSELDNEKILLEMCSCLGRMSEWNTDGATAAAVLLNRLDGCAAISDAAASAVLTTMKPMICKLPSCYADSLRGKLRLFPARALRDTGIAHLIDEPAVGKLKQCLQLLCDADHLLLQHCEELYASVHDDSKWDNLFKRMLSRVFENEFAGPDYQALARYRGSLDTVRHADSQMKRIVLKGIMQELKSSPARDTIRVSHVCPALGATPAHTPPHTLAGLGKLLQLPPGVEVVAIEEELCVFSDSVRRPCVVRMRDSNGRLRRYLHKNESLHAHASITYCPRLGDLGYKVIPLSEDCGLIEFLEEHKRIRELITSAYPVDEVSVRRQAAKDDELILAPPCASAHNYRQLCEQVPAYTLRCAIESHCVSVEDFIAKKRRFVDTLSDVTITCWLFGLGDRHLHNLLYGVREGALRCVDWGAVFQYGAGELPPARLTRSLLALTDTSVLCSKLESRVAALRDSVSRVLPPLRLAFRWMPDFHDKLVYIEGIMRGKLVAHQIIKDALQRSSKPHKHKYIELLDAVFAEHPPQGQYSVEEQVSCLLRACTEPAILGVTRSGWEPWL